MLLDARFYVDAFGHVRMYAHQTGEWIVVDWPWILASLSTDRRWTVHSERK